MAKDILKDTLDKIEGWCSQNNVSIFYGEIDENKATEVNWMPSDNSDWEKYLTVLKNAESRILTLTVRKNEFDDADEEISDYLETLDDDEKKDYNSAIATIKKNKGQIAYFKLTFFNNNISYQYQQQSDWIGEYQTVYETYAFDDDDDDNEIDENRLSDAEVEKAARKIISDKKYLEAKDRFERSRIANTLMRKDDIKNLHDTHGISGKAEEIFEAEIKPQQEAALRKQILDLKVKGLKKNEIRSKLKISSGVLDKYYFTDSD
jgi:hypothetical protein